MACGCVDRCSCYLEGVGGIIVTGSGDIGSPWQIAPPPEVVFAAGTIDGSIVIVPGGPFGHEPFFGVQIDPASTLPWSVSEAGLLLECCSSTSDVPQFVVIDINGDVVLVDTNTLVLVDASANDVTVSLPAIHTAGRIIKVKDVNGSVGGAFTITIDSADADLIDGLSTYVPNTPYQSIELISDGVNWSVN